ncbi:MAG: hypothetical protein PHT07_10345 [Paludibacter sp.]|nr:hypothetical protein [Paludibacter sp.]
MSTNVDGKKIMLIEFNASDVYVQYEDMDSESVSYSKAKRIFKDLTYPIRYSVCGTQKSLDFVNSISRKKYSTENGIIEPKVNSTADAKIKKHFYRN